MVPVEHASANKGTWCGRRPTPHILPFFHRCTSYITFCNFMSKYKKNRVIQSFTESCRVLQRLTELCRETQNKIKQLLIITDLYKKLAASYRIRYFDLYKILFNIFSLN